MPVPNTTYFRDQIYVAKLDTSGAVLWEDTYGGTNRHFANKIMMTGEGDLLVVPPHVPHAYGANGSHPWTIHWVHLVGSALREYLHELEVSASAPVTTSISLRRPSRPHWRGRAGGWYPAGPTIT